MPYDFFRSLMLPLREIDEALPSSGHIIDLGCGQGIITSFLAKRKTRQVTGVDINRKRLSKSTLVNLKFQCQNIMEFKISGVDGVVISDVLHHLSRPDQGKLLVKISKGLKKGGTLVIKEIDTNEFIRSKLTRLWDFILYPHDKISFSDSQTLTRNLKRLGFNVEVKKTVTWFPGSTNLYICKKL